MRKHKTFVVAGDNHGDVIDEVARAAFFRHLKEFKPDVRIHTGDNWDFRNFRLGASDEEKAESLSADWESGEEFIREFLTPGHQNYFLRGNHDQRLWRIAESTQGVIRDYARDGIKRVESIVRRCKAKMLPYDSRLGVLEIGHLRVIHGYAAGIGAAAKHARVYGNVFFGHTHSMEVMPVEDVHGPAEARGVGCLCEIDMPYNQHQMNKLRHQQGWIYGLLFDDGTYQAFQTKRVGDSFYATSTIQEI